MELKNFEKSQNVKKDFLMYNIGLIRIENVNKKNPKNLGNQNYIITSLHSWP
jgi:hypothetical protein